MHYIGMSRLILFKKIKKKPLDSVSSKRRQFNEELTIKKIVKNQKNIIFVSLHLL